MMEFLMDDKFKAVTIFVATGTICAGLAVPDSGECRPTREICQLAPEHQVHTDEREPVPGRTMPQITERASTSASAGTFYVVQR
jgi:hypothetical protein